MQIFFEKIITDALPNRNEKPEKYVICLETKVKLLILPLLVSLFQKRIEKSLDKETWKQVIGEGNISLIKRFQIQKATQIL